MLPFSQCDKELSHQFLKEDGREGLRDNGDIGENIKLLSKRDRVNGLGKYSVFARQYFFFLARQLWGFFCFVFLFFWFFCQAVFFFCQLRLIII